MDLNWDNENEEYVLNSEEEREIEESFFAGTPLARSELNRQDSDDEETAAGTIWETRGEERKRKSTDVEETGIPFKKNVMQNDAEKMFDKTHEEAAISYMSLNPYNLDPFTNSNVRSGSFIFNDNEQSGSSIWNDNIPSGRSIWNDNIPSGSCSSVLKNGGNFKLENSNTVEHDPYGHLKGRARAIALADARIAARESESAAIRASNMLPAAQKITKQTTETLTYNPRPKTHQEKRRKKCARADRDEVTNRICGLFERRRFYTFTELHKILKQPIPYLKEILLEICVINKEHPNKNKYSLKPEYCFYSDTHKLADNTDNMEDSDDDFVDVP